MALARCSGKLMLARGEAFAVLAAAMVALSLGEEVDIDHSNVPCELARRDAQQAENDNEYMDVHYSTQAQPVVLTGLTGGWAAHEKWTYEQLVQDYGDIPVLTSQMTNGFRSMWDWSEPLTVKDVLNSSLVFFTNEKLSAGLRKDIGTLPLFIERHDGILGISVGSKNSFAIHHSHKPGWFAQIKGRKLWVLTEPGARHAWSATYPDVCKIPEEIFETLPVKRCIVNPGEALYLPDMWGHSTCNLDRAVGTGVIGSFHGAVSYAVLHQKRTDLVTYMNMEQWIHDPNLADEALSSAAKYGHVPILRLLLRGGVSANASGTALLWAASRGRMNAMVFLANNGAEPWPTDKESTMAIEPASLNGQLDIVKKLHDDCPECYQELHAARSENGGQTPLHGATAEGHISVMDFLLTIDTTPSKEDSRQQLLYQAVEGGHVAAVDRILALRADPAAAESIKGGVMHALVVATVYGHIRVVDRLLQRDVAPNAANANDNNKQAIHYAAQYGGAHILEFLVKANADPEAKTQRGETPMDYARNAGHQPVLAMLEALTAPAHEEL